MTRLSVKVPPSEILHLLRLWTVFGNSHSCACVYRSNKGDDGIAEIAQKPNGLRYQELLSKQF